MKKLFSVFILLAIFIGCSSTQQSIAYKTIYSLELSVTAANSAYLDLLIKGKVSTNDAPRVARAFNLFQANILVALDAVQFNTNALAPTSLTIEAQDILNVINAAKGVK